MISVDFMPKIMAPANNQQRLRMFKGAAANTFNVQELSLTQFNNTNNHLPMGFIEPRIVVANITTCGYVSFF